ncbi:ESCRT-II complex, vps25 subunit [Gonapodya prolifera JEL478]|uniref:ESCRT-II complex, vps25 subunit n=1 Tax=Gonapodya prolifera (strain JEL478) TaxID=1344416 RepID=A0A139AW20_GONPJ|nr:ESCRT-II complex, vps25 subunit [Gonapodya prolifera JEL478]|eukprot:KXS20920.1 ESCRT-II complex, vps25 subunit [Gonapodya prolifera JEL478]
MPPFTFPPMHDFPPFFTLQPNPESRARQIQLWSELITRYCEDKQNLYIEPQEWLVRGELFSNEKIKRSVSPQLLNAIFDELARQGRLEWVDSTPSSSSPAGAANRARAVIWYRTPDEWAVKMHEWCRATSKVGQVCTLGDFKESEAFQPLDSFAALRCYEAAKRLGRADYFVRGGEAAVKFMP